MMSNKIRVVLADDHPVVRNGVRAVLDSSDDIQVVGEASTGAQTVALVREMRPDVLLLDMDMPDISGVEVAKQLRDHRTGCKILALSAFDDPQYIRNVLSAGAAGYLIKEEAPQFIIEAVQGVWRGETGWLSRKVAAKMTVWTRTDVVDYGLTPREKDVLLTIVQGKTNQEAGLALGISSKTVEKHMESIFVKLGVSSRVEAAVLAVREELV